MNILALDCGTKTGYAAYCNKTIQSGVQKFDLKRGESKGMRFIKFNAWLCEMLTAMRPELVVYEMAHHRGGAATELTIGMVTRIQEMCEKMEIEYTSIHSKSLKKFITGKGQADKVAMISAARKRYDINIIDDNHADALLMLTWARENPEIRADEF